MGFVVKTAKVTGTDPRAFVIPGLKSPAQISLDNEGNCKGFQVGGGRFTSLKVSADAFSILKPEVVKAAEAASDSVDKAKAAGKFRAVPKDGYTAWEYTG